jgi:hypothetical protein
MLVDRERHRLTPTFDPLLRPPQPTYSRMRRRPATDRERNAFFAGVKTESNDGHNRKRNRISAETYRRDNPFFYAQFPDFTGT